MSAPTAPPQLNFQGIMVDAGAVNPGLFALNTRRKRTPEKVQGWAGIGGTENLGIRKSDILSRAKIRLSGSLTIVLNAGTVATTAAWPYGLVKNLKTTANGATNLIDTNGPVLKALEFMTNEDLDDRGVPQSVAGVTVQNGTLSKSSEAWGLGNQQAAIAAGTYNFELEWQLPLAEDQKDLTGAIFCQTASTDLNVAIVWAALSDLFITTGAPAITFNACTVMLETEKFSIPVVNGQMCLPDLSLFHSIITTSTAPSNGEFTPRVLGQGSGKQLMRLLYRVLNGVGANLLVPLPVNVTSYGQQAWVYGSNDRPETYQDGRSMRYANEELYGTDIAAVWGFLCHDFASVNAFRDSVDMGQTSELRFASTIQTGVVLASPQFEYTQETLFAAGS